MFTGITRGTFAIVEVIHGEGALSYTVELTTELVDKLEPGASVAIDGVCQTVVWVKGARVRFDAIGETLDKTTLSDLHEGRRVSVERSYKVGDEVGGHEVAGHVSGVGEVGAVRREGDNCVLRIDVQADWMKYILDKGFISIDGSSLTVANPDAAGSFELHLIPETLRLTNLGSAEAGRSVNVELDHRTVAIVETVERVLAQRELD